jgi:hypothetical protein
MRRASSSSSSLPKDFQKCLYLFFASPCIVRFALTVWWACEVPRGGILGRAFRRRSSAIGALLVAMLMAGLPAAFAQVEDFDPEIFVDVGNQYNCADFDNQAQAQQVLRADPSDPNGLDPDRNGIACSNLPAPQDLNKVDQPQGGSSSGSEDGRDGASVTGKSGNSVDGEDDVASSASPAPTPSVAARTSRSSIVSPASVARPVIPEIAPLAAVVTGASPAASPSPKGSSSAGGSIGSGEGLAGGTAAGAPGGAVGSDDDATGGEKSAARIARTGGYPLLFLAIFAFMAVLGVLLRKEVPLED